MPTDELDVWVGGRYAGALIRHDAEIAFVYDPGYQAERYTPALSVSMPKSRREHRGDEPRRWIDNLLPDNDDVRERWAAVFGERRTSAFNLLRHMGQDCAGAVQVMPTGVPPHTTGDGTSVTDAEIEARLHWMRETATRLAADLPVAVEQALDEAGDTLDPGERRAFHTGIIACASAAERSLSAGEARSHAAKLPPPGDPTWPPIPRLRARCGSHRTSAQAGRFRAIGGGGPAERGHLGVGGR